MLRQLEAEHARGLDPSLAGQLLDQLNRFCNVWRPEDRASWTEARAELTPLYAQRNGDHSHEVAAIGHAHIDTAWLWPIAETYRKCVRTFSSQTAYMDAYPEYRFACSQAQQYAWIKQRNPDLYERIRQRVARGQFIPVGGTWVEPDCNIPSGESLVRQFLLGQSFFEREFGRRCREFWNPDVFGYNGQLPQIMRGAGIERFLTQKLSWNRFNRPAYHSFLWQGIDGSRVLTHFPPADTYNGIATVEEIRRTARDYKEHDRSHTSFLLYGYGDGGGGPVREMLEVLRRVGDLQGVPRTTQRSSEEFFCDARSARPPTGRSTSASCTSSTTAGRTPHRPRSSAPTGRASSCCTTSSCSSALAHWRGARPYPRDEITRLWQVLCCNQFHDIIPGSSITEVYEDAARDYDEIWRAGESLRESALAALGDGSAASHPLNTVGVSRRGVVRSPGGDNVLVATPALGTGRIVHPDEPVALTEARPGLAARERASARRRRSGRAIARASSTSEPAARCSPGPGTSSRSTRTSR